MMPDIQLTLVGKIGMWGQRIRADGRGVVWVAWLRHASCGTIGIYVLPKPVALAEALPSRTWVQLRGLLQPLRVLALEDDPRSEHATTLSPLLLHATSVTASDRATPSPPREQQPIQVRSGRWIGTGYLAWTRHIVDIACFLSAEQPTSALYPWSHPYGVVAHVDQRCYVRYVLM